MIRSMLTMEEMWLKSRLQDTFIDFASSSPMVLLANSGPNARCSTSSTEKFDAFGFSVKDFLTHRVLLRCDSTEDLYPVTKPSNIPQVFLTSQYTWQQHLGHPRSVVLCRVLSSNLILYIKEKPLVLCHACQLGKHVRLQFVSSTTSVQFCFDIVYSDLWNSQIPSTDVAKSTRKRSKPDKHRHENGKECTRAGDLIAEISSKWSTQS
ncbi:hypothetical protein Tco_1408986 [Tanacetum coccineum]